MTGLEILGTGRCLPQHCVTNDDMARMVDLHPHRHPPAVFLRGR